MSDPEKTDTNWRVQSALWLHWMEDNPRTVLLVLSHVAAFAVGAVIF